MYPNPLPQNRIPYQPAAFLALPLGAVIPRGWLLSQLEVQASGISGHLDEYWPDVGSDSGWLGGPGDDWERAPYYCDGLVPLAYLLQAAGSSHGPRLVAKASRYISWMLDSRKDNGYFGPANPDWWPRMVALKVLMSYYEAGVTHGQGDERVLHLMASYFHYMDDMLDSTPLHGWGAARGSDNLLAVQWLYNRTSEAFLIDLGRKLQAQTMDWPALQGRYEVEKSLKMNQHRGNMGTHVVNNAQGIKTGAVWYVQSGEAWHRQAPARSIENLMKHHGQPNGIWSGDEHLHGTSPTAGTELCGVVEYMYSLEELLRILGDPSFGDALEAAAYNALPGTFKADMWAHQYDQQVNQALASVAKRDWANNGDDANIYGQTPNFGCCQANFHQGWPKLARSLVMATADGGMAVTAWAPCEARAFLPGFPVRLVVDTSYPFDGRAVVRVHLPEGKPVSFPLLLRIPSWAGGTQVTVGMAGKPPVEWPNGEPGKFLRIEREWSDGNEVTLRFPFEPRVTRGHNDLVSIFRGPLLFGLHIEEEWVQIGGTPPAGDWEIYPRTPWNYGLALSGAVLGERPGTGALRSTFTVETRPPGPIPFGDGPQTAPVVIKVKARRIPGWGLEHNSAAEIEAEPDRHGTRGSDQPLEEVTLLPYGSTCLRIAALPLAET